MTFIRSVCQFATLSAGLTGWHTRDLVDRVLERRHRGRNVNINWVCLAAVLDCHCALALLFPAAIETVPIGQHQLTVQYSPFIVSGVRVGGMW